MKTFIAMCSSQGINQRGFSSVGYATHQDSIRFCTFLPKEQNHFTKKETIKRNHAAYGGSSSFSKKSGGGKRLDLLSILEETHVQYLGIFVNYTCFS